MSAAEQIIGRSELDPSKLAESGPKHATLLRRIAESSGLAIGPDGEPLSTLPCGDESDFEESDDDSATWAIETDHVESKYADALRSPPRSPALPALRPSASMTNLSTMTHAASRTNLHDMLSAGLSQVVPANLIVQNRNGSILSRGMVLKSDRFPSATPHKPFEVNVNGSPNFRQIRPSPIYATAQPTVPAIRAILNMMNCRGGSRKRALWVNLREEPVVYLNNRPFVLRDLEYPFRNMVDFKGVHAQRLADIEGRLKEDILHESEDNNGNIIVHDEQELGEIKAVWESVDRTTVHTSAEVYERLQREGYRVQYVRVPVTAESIFEPQQFDAVVSAFVEATRELDGDEVAFVFN